MAFRDLIRSISGAFSRVTGENTRRPDGGTSHYRPLRKKSAEPAGSMENPGETQAVPYVHTGFTGMNPPAGFGYETGIAPGQMSFSRMDSAPQQSYVGMGSFGGQTSFAPPSRDNISYMPGFAPASPDKTPAHVEHIVTLTGLQSCYDTIECMKNGETLIVMLDAIANESESMRCQDMLAGAAFTLGCTVRMLHGARIVVIAPENVKILPEQRSSAEMYSPAERMAARVQEAAEAPRPGRRERRTGTNAAEWNAARSGGGEGYNPYTGTMPVAAGAYGSFGGYGY